ncbi:hypothetical protein L218DRAFT_252125 [Marasmius fiardii PR-910]|nr:hypothetical protein L218DRAFT_252125 [Marasmius fiardii PR-910]
MQSNPLIVVADQTSYTSSSTSTPSFLQTFTLTIIPGAAPSLSPTVNNGSKSADTTMVTALIILGVVLPAIVVISTVFWCWYIKRRPKNGMVIERLSGRDFAPANPREKPTYNVALSKSQSDQIKEWVARSKSQRSSTTVWTDYTGSSLSTEYRPPSPSLPPLPRAQSVQSARPSSMTTHRSDDSDSLTEYRPASPGLFSIAESASLYSQPSFRSSKPGSLRNHRTGRSQSSQYGNLFGSKFSSSNDSNERHIYADSSLAVLTRPKRLSMVREDDVGH